MGNRTESPSGPAAPLRVGALTSCPISRSVPDLLGASGTNGPTSVANTHGCSAWPDSLGLPWTGNPDSVVVDRVDVFDSESPELLAQAVVVEAELAGGQHGASRRFSLESSLERSSTFGADVRGTTHTPSSSPTTRSPGRTVAPAQMTGMFTEPAVSFTVPWAWTAPDQTGKSIALSSATSRTPASITSATPPRVHEVKWRGALRTFRHWMVMWS